MTQAPDRLLTPKEAAERLAITVEQLSALVFDGEMAYVAVGRGSKRPRRRFTEADLDDFIERRRRRETPLPMNAKTRRFTNVTSNSAGTGFMARREGLLAEKRKKAEGLLKRASSSGAPSHDKA